MNNFDPNKLNDKQTEQFILSTLDEQISSHIHRDFSDVMKGYELKMKKTQLIKKTVGIAAVFALGCAVGFGSYYFSPQAYVSIDINPSIELKTNFADRVIDANGANEDAAKVLAAVHINNKPIDQAVKEIVEQTVSDGYINDKKDNAVLITVESKKDGKAEKVDQAVKNAVDEILKDKKQNAQIKDIITDINDKTQKEESKETADKLGISEGKAAAINMLMEKLKAEGIKDITADDLAKLSVKDIIDLLDEKEDTAEELKKEILEEIDEAVNGDIYDDDDDKDDIDDDDDDKDDIDDDDDDKDDIDDDDDKDDIDDDDDDDKDDIDDDDDDDKDDIDDDDDDDKDDDDDDDDDDITAQTPMPIINSNSSSSNKNNSTSYKYNKHDKDDDHDYDDDDDNDDDDKNDDHDDDDDGDDD